MHWKQLWERSEGPRCAVFTDIDNTLVRAGCEADSRRLRDVLAERNIPLVAVTGPRFSSVFRRIRTGELPLFAAVVSEVGTDIRQLNLLAEGGPTYERDETWADYLLASGFHREHAVVRELCEQVNTLQAQRPDWGLELQPGEPQQFKLSWYFRAASTEVAAKIAEQLARSCSPFRTAWCQDITFCEEGQKRFCFDVLAADKRDAVDYLVRQMDLEDGLVAGDSGNDITMILDTCHQVAGVVVGGAQPELLEAVRGFRQRQGKGPGIKRLWVDESQRLGPQSLLAAVEQFFKF